MVKLKVPALRRRSDWGSQPLDGFLPSIPRIRLAVTPHRALIMRLWGQWQGSKWLPFLMMHHRYLDFYKTKSSLNNLLNYRLKVRVLEFGVFKNCMSFADLDAHEIENSDKNLRGLGHGNEIWIFPCRRPWSWGSQLLLSGSTQLKLASWCLCCDVMSHQ